MRQEPQQKLDQITAEVTQNSSKPDLRKIMAGCLLAHLSCQDIEIPEHHNEAAFQKLRELYPNASLKK
jgi:hypothetical protein